MIMVLLFFITGFFLFKQKTKQNVPGAAALLNCHYQHFAPFPPILCAFPFIIIADCWILLLLSSLVHLLVSSVFSVFLKWMTKLNEPMCFCPVKLMSPTLCSLPTHLAGDILHHHHLLLNFVIGINSSPSAMTSVSDTRAAPLSFLSTDNRQDAV